MAKRKAKTDSIVRKKTVTKKASRTKVPKAKTAKQAKSARKKVKTAAKSKPKKKAVSKKKASVPKKARSLGRPKVTGEEKLYMLFKEDFHARQIFTFLRVETVRELEQFSPKEIVKRLSKPIKDTVNRIRLKLAEKNRHLLEDKAFALDRQGVDHK
jgi:hypothetical protein